MNYPKIKFLIDAKKDLDIFYLLNKDIENNPNVFNWAFLDKYPELSKYKKNNFLEISKKELNIFIHSIYKKDAEIMDKNILKYENDWGIIEGEFYDLVSDIFGLYNFPEGKYIGYLTIWGMYPRFLNDKTFCIPYFHKKEKYINVIIAHEMLHFIFYDYFYKNYPKYNEPKYNFFVWYVSEIFNSLIQNSKEWLDVFDEESMAYPEHNKIIKNIRDLKINNLDDLIDEIVKEVNNLKLI